MVRSKLYSALAPAASGPSDFDWVCNAKPSTSRSTIAISTLGMSTLAAFSTVPLTRNAPPGATPISFWSRAAVTASGLSRTKAAIETGISSVFSATGVKRTAYSPAFQSPFRGTSTAVFLLAGNILENNFVPPALINASSPATAAGDVSSTATDALVVRLGIFTSAMPAAGLPPSTRSARSQNASHASSASADCAGKSPSGQYSTRPLPRRASTTTGLACPEPACGEPTEPVEGFSGPLSSTASSACRSYAGTLSAPCFNNDTGTPASHGAAPNVKGLSARRSQGASWPRGSTAFSAAMAPASAALTLPSLSLAGSGGGASARSPPPCVTTSAYAW